MSGIGIQVVQQLVEICLLFLFELEKELRRLDLFSLLGVHRLQQPQP